MLIKCPAGGGLFRQEHIGGILLPDSGRAAMAVVLFNADGTPTANSSSGGTAQQVALDGQPATAYSQDTGGIGDQGMLSSIALRLAAILKESGASANAPVAAAAAAGVVAGANQAGRLHYVEVTSAQNLNTAPLVIRDGSAAGTIIAQIPANIGPGPFSLGSSRFFGTALYVASGAGTPAVTLGYSV